MSLLGFRRCLLDQVNKFVYYRFFNLVCWSCFGALLSLLHKALVFWLHRASPNGSGCLYYYFHGSSSNYHECYISSYTFVVMSCTRICTYICFFLNVLFYKILEPSIKLPCLLIIFVILELFCCLSFI